jgi:hypothetical protein
MSPMPRVCHIGRDTPTLLDLVEEPFLPSWAWRAAVRQFERGFGGRALSRLQVLLVGNFR